MPLSPHCPDVVLLREVPFNLENPLDDSLDNAVDYIAPQGWSFLQNVNHLIDSAPKKVEGKPSLVHFISFIRGDDNVRKAIKVAVEKTNSKDELIPKNTHRYNEVIPPGYNGYLNLNQNASDTVIPALKETLLIVARAPYQNLTGWINQLKAEAIKVGVDVLFEFGDITDPELKNRSGNVAVLGLFKGNLKDPIGSWSFLSDPKHGALRGYSSFVETALSKAVETDDQATQSKILSDLHRQLLERQIIIPLWCESLFMLYNKNVSAIHVNQFDFRIHFYEVQMN
jgi:hypothetical protein